MYDAETGRELTDEEATAVMDFITPDSMEGHRERVATYERMAADAATEIASVTRGVGTRKPRGARPLTREKTAAQLHKIEHDAAMVALNDRVQGSGLWAGQARSRRSWCARLRELELHPERAEAIRVRGRNVKVEGKVRT